MNIAELKKVAAGFPDFDEAQPGLLQCYNALKLLITTLEADEPSNVILTPKEIADLRYKLGLSQADFAARVGVEQKAVSTWERGLVVPRPHHMVKLNELRG